VFWVAVILVLLSIVVIGVYLGLRYDVGIVKGKAVETEAKGLVEAERVAAQGQMAISRLQTSRE